jgi:hypothetical protein
VDELMKLNDKFDVKDDKENEVVEMEDEDAKSTSVVVDVNEDNKADMEAVDDKEEEKNKSPTELIMEKIEKPIKFYSTSVDT